jgi:hypothetical protein
MLVAASMLTACGTMTLIGATDPVKRDVCSKVFGPVTYSSRDTPETQLQARRNNAAYDSYCKGKK